MGENGFSKNDFEFISVIGRGAFGKVLKVEHKKTKKIYADSLTKLKKSRHLWSAKKNSAGACSMTAAKCKCCITFFMHGAGIPQVI